MSCTDVKWGQTGKELPLTPFTYAVFLSLPVALCLTTYIFTTNVTEELKIRVGFFSSRRCWAKLCCTLWKTSYAFWASSLLPNALPNAQSIYSSSTKAKESAATMAGQTPPFPPRSSPTLVVFAAPCSKLAIIFGRESQDLFVWKQFLAQQKLTAKISFKGWWDPLTLRDESGILDSCCSSVNLYTSCLRLTL